VVDDYPGYFPIYRQSGVPDRIGFLRPRKYSRQQYIERGAQGSLRAGKNFKVIFQSQYDICQNECVYAFFHISRWITMKVETNCDLYEEEP